MMFLFKIQVIESILYIAFLCISDQINTHTKSVMSQTIMIMRCMDSAIHNKHTINILFLLSAARWN